jgi:putative Na+/H+ antiporter
MPEDSALRLRRVAVLAIALVASAMAAAPGLAAVTSPAFDASAGAAADACTTAEAVAALAPFPPPLESYGDADLPSLSEVLAHRVAVQPFNLWATLLFLGAILHTFFTHRFRHIAHRLQRRLEERFPPGNAGTDASGPAPAVRRISAAARMFHFLGEVEAVFGIWVLPLLLVMAGFVGRDATMGYINHRVHFTEAIFVIVIMSIASTRPVLDLAESLMGLGARLGGGTPAAWWLSILIAGPLLGSFITEPGAMTICAALLGRRIYARRPGRALAYATLGLLFVAVSAGGTLTHFAAPPILMVAGPWGWDLAHMLEHFGWRAALGITISAVAYAVIFRRDLARLGTAPVTDEGAARALPIPLWVTAGHVGFLVLAVLVAHYPVLMAFTGLGFLAFVQITEDFQRDFRIGPPVLVGFFLAGLVVHGGLQQWWIAPVLGRLGEVPLMLGATFLTAFNDNAAITYLATLVPTFTEGMKYAVVAGAVTGGGLTVIANAPNPAGQSILDRHFEDGISPLGLFLGALAPTVIVGLAFMLFR